MPRIDRSSTTGVPLRVTVCLSTGLGIVSVHLYGYSTALKQQTLVIFVNISHSVVYPVVFAIRILNVSFNFMKSTGFRVGRP